MGQPNTPPSPTTRIGYPDDRFLFPEINDDRFWDDFNRGLAIIQGVPVEKRVFEEAKHPRDAKGEFTHSGEQSVVDVRSEYAEALKQAGQYKFESSKLNAMAAMLHKRRADALPEVVSDKEVQSHVAQGAAELWRGVKERKYGHKFRGGPLFIGTGILGSGQYVAMGPQGRAYAMDYAGNGEGDLLHMALKPDAKVGEWMEVVHEMTEASKKVNMNDPINRVLFTDTGVYATAAGYDALLSRNLGMGILLNRSVVRVARENAIAKALVLGGNAELSRQIAKLMDTDRMAAIILSPRYIPFVEAVCKAAQFGHLPEWCREEIGESELERNGQA